MLPLLRLLAIGIKMCTSPIIVQIRSIAQVKAAGRVRFFLSKAGSRIHFYEYQINQRFLGIKDPGQMLELSEDENVERALSFFLEVFVLYGIFFYWAITETLDSMESSKQLKKDLDYLMESNEKLKKDFDELKKGKEESEKKKLEEILLKRLEAEKKENELNEIINNLTKRIVVLENNKKEG